MSYHLVQFFDGGNTNRCTSSRNLAKSILVTCISSTYVDTVDIILLKINERKWIANLESNPSVFPSLKNYATYLVFRLLQ